MSLIAYEAVWELKLQPSEKLIMLCLAEHHNKDTDQCNPAYKTIAEETGLSKQHVIRLVAKLEINGVIAIKNKAGCGSGNSNNYEISVLKGNVVLPLVTPELSQKVTQKVTSEQIKGNTVLPEPIREPIEPKTTPIGVAAKPQPAEGPKTKIKDSFLELTHLEMPNLKRDTGYWWSRFGEILHLARGDPVLACRWQTEAVGYMQSSGLTITGPQSILGMIRALASGQPLQQYKNGATINGHKQRSGPLQQTGEILDEQPINDIYTGEYIYPDGRRISSG